MVKLNAGVALLSLCLGLAFFAGQPVAAHGRGGRGKKEWRGGGGGGKKVKVIDNNYGGGKEDTTADTVYTVVAEAIKKKPGVGPALVRLLFHDCWVYGCDGSVLLDSVPYGSKTEKNATNNIGLDGFEVIDKIKEKLGSLSCADIVVLAAREATFILSHGKIDYTVYTGRTDGVVSSPKDADDVLPPSTFDVTELKVNFLAKGFDTTELVALSGAHAIGVAHRSSFKDRLDKDTETPISDDYQQELLKDVNAKTNSAVKDPTEPNNIRDMDQKFRTLSGYDPKGVDTAARGVLDNSYYHANLQNRVLFRSDWEPRTDTVAEQNMETFKANATEWYLQFGYAMAKLSKLLGENPSSVNRTNCRQINKNKY